MAPTDGQLVQRSRDGDRQAFSELVDRYRDMAYGLGYHLTGEFEAARDLAQESFVQAYLKLGQLREPDKFARWLRRIVADLHHRQSRRRHLPTVALSDAQAAPQRPEPSEIEVVIRDALSRLREPERLALTLHYINGYSQAEIGAFLGVRPETVKTRLARARQRLKREVMTMVEDTFESKKLPDEFTQEAVEAAVARAEAELKQGRVGPAIEAYQSVLERAQDHLPALLGLGRAYQAAGADDEALRHLRRVLDLDPADQEAWGLVQQIYGGERKRFEQLVALYEEQLERHPEQATYLHTSLADACCGLRRYDLAEGHIRKILEADRDSLEARIVLAGLLAHQGRYDEAIPVRLELDRRLPELDWGRAGVAVEFNRYELAETYGAAGRYDEAIETAGSVLRNERTSQADRIVERCLMVIERCHHEAGRLNDFAALCRSIREQVPHRDRVDRLTWYLALFLESRLQREEAMAEFERLGAIPARCWRVAVPFDNTEGRGMARAYPPEEGVARDDSGAGGDEPYPRWRRPLCDGAGYELNFLRQIRLSPIHEWGVGYGLLHVVSPDDRDAVFRFGASGWAQIWVNGQSIYLNRPFTGTPDQEHTPLKLRRGRNDLLVKVGVHQALPSVRSLLYYWTVFSRITDVEGEPLRDLQFPLGNDHSVRRAWRRCGRAGGAAGGCGRQIARPEVDFRRIV
jgi:RNA polymerase sigma-70 factor (ECF subfamily)